MSMPSEILWDYLVTTAGLFSNPDNNSTWPLYINELPDGLDSNNTSACVSDTSGLFDGKTMNGSLNQHYGIQIRFRSESDTEGYAKASTVEAALATVHGVDITIESGTTYKINNVSQASPIVRMGSDDKRRSNFSLNFLLSVTKI